ncbi:PrsW family glutamic-type intramembrane protease [Microvirga arsenatis]|uniref:PrsW family intramembrane metalloprotease n=1 Tax=Microvirga arsenatis TaxID=2692265 RepID=A0ABW9Z0K7_9HYPH|nr:PrsW family glutamic-type intramembrane protease [Microvirga arsenatis]NBJ11364.1 PrsW family intramembrane metalloprotease [Microvirga arsenatis]NBJ25637.1 PrsW family intramembrane metalloprotease [Microvirga arsenatis]
MPVPDALLRLSALLSAIAPAIWLGLLLVYAARRRVTAEAVNIAVVGGSLSALTVAISFLTLSSVAAGSDIIGIKGAVAISFLSAALPEEAAKLAVLLTIVYRHEDVRTPLDLILTAGWVGLGFAGLENVFYVLSELDGDRQWPIVALARAVTAVPSHTVMGLLMGLLLARAAEKDTRKGWWIAAAFLGPFLLHGIYDVFVLSHRDQSSGLQVLLKRWEVAFGLGVVIATETWLFVALLRQARARWSGDAAPSARSTGAGWTRLWFVLVVFPTVLVALCMTGLGGYGIWTQHSLSSLMGTGIAWLGIVFAMRILRQPAEGAVSGLTPSPQVPISKDLASG